MPRWLQLLIFLAIASIVLAAIHAFLWWRLVHATDLVHPWRKTATVALVLLGSSIPAAFLLAPALSPPWREAAAWPAFTWLGMMFVLLVVVLGLDGSRLVVSTALGALSLMPPLEPGRDFTLARIVALAALALTASLTVGAIWNARSAPRLKELEIVVPNLSSGMDGTTIMLLSDIHVGPTLGRAFVERVVAASNAMSPDIVAITGDLVDYDVDVLRDAVAPLAGLDARFGVFFVTGNHEYYAGVERWVSELRSLGLKVLLNEHAVVGEQPGLIVAGVTDPTGRSFAGHEPDLEAALAGRDPDLPVVLLSHQPVLVREAARLDVEVQLSGHTHHGQIWPWSLAVRLQQPYVRGLVEHGPTQLYTSPGTGYWGPPMRLGSRAELTLITLRRDTGGVF